MQRQSVRDLPPNTNPVGTRCIQITIPDDDEWERDLYSEVYRLTRWMLWERDLGHNGKPVADKWLAAMNTWRHCPETEVVLGSGCEGDDCMGCCLRIQDGFLQCLSCGEWVNVPGQPSGGLLGGGVSGPGTTPPSAGQCQSYSGAVEPPKSWLLPALVNTGDLLTITAKDGSTTEASPIGSWSCPDGGLFVGGICFSDTFLDASALRPDLPVGQLLWYVNGVYFDALTPFTVPSGILNQQALIVVNNTSSGIKAGKDTFTVQFCNNQAAAWSSVFNFAISSYSSLLTGVHGTWTLGVGYVGIDAGGSIGTQCYLRAAAAALSMTQMDALYDASAFTAPHNEVVFDTAGAPYSPTLPQIVGTNTLVSYAAPATVTDPGFEVLTGQAGATCAIRQLKIYGVGAKPVGWP